MAPQIRGYPSLVRQERQHYLVVRWATRYDAIRDKSVIVCPRHARR